MVEDRALSQSENQQRRSIIIALLLTAMVIFTLAALLIPFYSNQIDSQISAGEVASREINAPRSLTYTSEVLTEAQRENPREGESTPKVRYP